MTPTERIMAQAHRLGFDLVAIAPAAPPTTAGAYEAWLDQAYHGQMAYLARPDAVAKRADLDQLLPGVRSVLAVAANYHTRPLPPALGDDPARGLFARYAWGQDYHDILTTRLRQLAAWLEAETGGPVAARACVDTAPLLERELAARAGLGFVGKNTNLIHPRLGSWLFLGELLLAVELLPTVSAPPGRPELAAAGPRLPAGTCGRCTRCLDACPTGALVAPYVLDARRCIAYLTIELKGPIPRDLRPQMGHRVFGCDLCQEACPWNQRFAQPTQETAFQPGPDTIAPHLLELIALDKAGFRQRFRGSPVQRARRRGLLRNVAVALGNWGEPAAVPALSRALDDPEALIRGHAAWALGRIATAEARHALHGALLSEVDPWVRDEIQIRLFPNSL